LYCRYYFIRDSLTAVSFKRKYWLQRIEKEGTELEKFIAKWAKTEK